MAANKHHRTSLTERLAIAFLSGFSALLTASVIWLVLFLGLTQLATTDGPPAFWPVLLFSLTLAVLGFMTRIDLATTILAKIWHVLYHFFRIWF